MPFTSKTLPGRSVRRRLKLQLDPRGVMVAAIASVFGPPVNHRLGDFSGKRLAHPDLVEEFITGNFRARRVKSTVGSFHSTQNPRNRFRLSFPPVVRIDGTLHRILCVGNKVAFQVRIVEIEKLVAVVCQDFYLEQIPAEDTTP